MRLERTKLLRTLIGSGRGPGAARNQPLCQRQPVHWMLRVSQWPVLRAIFEFRVELVDGEGMHV